MSPRRAVTLAPTAAVYATAAAATYGLKAHFSSANGDALRWVLAPTCWLAGRVGGIAFVDEAGAGFISHSERLVVGPACSGLNFLIICFAALFFALAHRLDGARRRAAWLAASLALAYLATILTNAARVVIAARLYQTPVESDLLTPARLHRLMGTLLYCVSLLGLHRAADRWIGARSAHGRALAWLSPLAFYVGMTVVVPLLHRPSLGGDARFLEHAGFVGATIVVLAALASGAGFWLRTSSTPPEARARLISESADAVSSAAPEVARPAWNGRVAGASLAYAVRALIRALSHSET
jgi:exosortase K